MSDSYAAAEIVPYEAEARKKAMMSSRLLKLRLIRLHYEHAPKEIKDQHLPVLFREIEKCAPIEKPVPEYVLPDPVDLGDKPVNVIVDMVAKYFRVPSWQILGDRKTYDLVIPRHVAIYLATEFTVIPYAALARHFRRDHTIILHARRKVLRDMENDAFFKIKVMTLHAQISSISAMPKVDHVARMREMASKKFYRRVGVSS